MNDLLEYRGYYATTDFSVEDKVFHGKLVGINDLVTFEGDSVKDLINAFQDAVEDYLETCKEIGKSPDKTYKGSFNIRIPSELHREAALQANMQKLSLNDFVRKAIDFTIEVSKQKQSLWASKPRQAKQPAKSKQAKQPAKSKQVKQPAKSKYATK